MLELDFRAVKFLFFPRRDLNHTIDALQHHSLSLTSSTLDHSNPTKTHLLTHFYYCNIKQIKLKNKRRLEQFEDTKLALKLVALSVPDEGYSSNVPCALNYISMFLL